MNAPALLTLLSDLYSQLLAVTAERDALVKQLAELEPAPGGDA